ncbi:hypothetical protein HYY75_08785 [bacterium]|nr:hypothetical protein [bacterium]
MARMGGIENKTGSPVGQRAPVEQRRTENKPNERPNEKLGASNVEQPPKARPPSPQNLGRRIDTKA